jgi:hypothetical protein
MKHSLDNALNNAELLSLTDDEATADFLYTTMRQSFAAALDTARALQSSEPQQAIEWVLAHLPEDVNADVRVTINGPNLDPRVHLFASPKGRARWIWETQRERLQAAAGALRTANDRAMVGAVPRKEILEWLKGIDDNPSNRANTVKRNKLLVEVSRGMYTRASFEVFKLDKKPKGKRREKYEFDID